MIQPFSIASSLIISRSFFVEHVSQALFHQDTVAIPGKRRRYFRVLREFGLAKRAVTGFTLSQGLVGLGLGVENTLVLFLNIFGSQGLLPRFSFHSSDNDWLDSANVIGRFEILIFLEELLDVFLDAVLKF